MSTTLINSLLELAHATSQNLGFAHGNDSRVSYGEETITETNLLELHRRHPKMVHLWTFGKREEALNGADWEWHIIGRSRKFRMRVQAKRLQKDNKLKIPHKVASSSKQQIDLLIADARKHGLKPVYCLYASEIQRAIWQKGAALAGAEEFEYGCLISSAHKVKAKMPKKLSEIEADCVPWHYLVDRRRYSERKIAAVFGDGATLGLLSAIGPVPVPVPRASSDSYTSVVEFPTLEELNAFEELEMNIEGVVEAKSPEYSTRMSDDAFRERGISRLLEIDVRDIPPPRRPNG